jgi:hypothetical protein
VKVHCHGQGHGAKVSSPKTTSGRSAGSQTNVSLNTTCPRHPGFRMSD